MRNLDEIRVDIDRVDKKLKELFIERMGYVSEVATYKKANNLPIKQTDREQAILENKIQDLNEFKIETKKFFKGVIDISCQYQSKKIPMNNIKNNNFKKLTKKEFLDKINKVYFQGTKGSYSHKVCTKLFPHHNHSSKKTFEDVFSAVANDSQAIGVIPIENLLAGNVGEVLDLLYNNKLYINLSYVLNISHCLLGKGCFNDIDTVSSHPQALMQCSKFIKDNGFKTINAFNTAIAARDLKDLNVGVIADEINSQLYNLDILKKDIADHKDNKTRFIIISKHPTILENCDTITAVFHLQHEVGSLCEILTDFSLNGINLSALFSRPLKNGEWEYVFYVDIIGNLLDEKIKQFLDSSDSIRILGNFETIR